MAKQTFINQEEISHYLKDVRKKTVLTPKREKELSVKIQDPNTTEAEKRLIERYLPKQLTEDELKTIISVMVIKNEYNMPRDMGKVMQSLAEEYPGKYDGKIASTIARSCK